MPEIRKIQTKSIFLISEHNDVPAKGISKIATNQSLNQKVPMFPHRGFLFICRALNISFRFQVPQFLQMPSTTTSTWLIVYPLGSFTSGVTTSSRQ